MKILVPIDGSAASVDAAKKALEIARKYDFQIKLISVVDIDKILSYRRNASMWRSVDGSILDTRTLLEMEEIPKKLMAEANSLLDEITDELDFFGVDLEKEVLTGEPYEVILETAKKENFDLIVMGNRGFSKIKRFFVGSVTQKVIAEATCPVLVVHSDVKE